MTTDAEDLKTTLVQLSNDPLAHLMVSHRELFHSNMIAWFFVFFEEPADEVFGRMTRNHMGGDAPREVQREKNNIDLLFTWPNRGTLLIENKIFSIPREEQLARYGVGQDQRTSCWLLSMIDPGWREGVRRIGKHDWRFKSYWDLGSEIEASLRATPPSFERELMLRYAAMVKRFASLTQLVSPKSDSELVELNAEQRDALESSRFGSGMEKVRAAQTMRSIIEHLPSGIDHREKIDFTNGTSLLECFYATAANPDVELGWQLQGGQFRLAMRSSRPIYVDRQLTDEGEAATKQHPQHFSFADVDRVLGTSHSDLMPRGDGHFNKYGATFIYRYKKTPRLTIAQLKAAAHLVFDRVGAGH